MVRQAHHEWVYVSARGELVEPFERKTYVRSLCKKTIYGHNSKHAYNQYAPPRVKTITGSFSLVALGWVQNHYIRSQKCCILPAPSGILTFQEMDQIPLI